MLVVDDSAVMRKIISRSYREAGYSGEIVEAEDGKDALEKFQKDKFDLIICDWIMPNMSGLEFVKRVRASEFGRRIPILMITSQGTLGKMEEALKAGVDEYIVKPFTSADLKQKLDKILKKGR